MPGRRRIIHVVYRDEVSLESLRRDTQREVAALSTLGDLQVRILGAPAVELGLRPRIRRE